MIDNQLAIALARAEVAEARVAVLGGEWCAANRAEGRGPCGACAHCCAVAIAERDEARLALRTVTERLAAATAPAPVSARTEAAKAAEPFRWRQTACSTCGGRGTVRSAWSGLGASARTQRTCPLCNGAGTER